MTYDPIICVHIGRSTWQGPASAAPRKEDRMTTDKTEPAGDALLPCPFCGNDRTDPIEDADAIHVLFSEHDFRGPVWSVQCYSCDATSGCSDSEDEAVAAWNRRAAPAAAPQPACAVCAKPCNTEEDGGPECQLHNDLWVCSRECYERHPEGAAPQPAPQPDADEREALVAAIRKDLNRLVLDLAADREAMVEAIREGCAGYGWLPAELPGDIADALLAAGWTRKREEAPDLAAERERLLAENERMRGALALARSSHGVMLPTDPPQDAWKARRVDAVIASALAAAPIQPAPQPDADKREAMVAALDRAILDHIGADISDEDVGAIADALLAAGWTRKREG